MRYRDLSFEFESLDGFYIAYEILVRRTYGIRFPGPAVVLDIGANFGLASLSFAQLPEVEQVYAWEPIPETYSHLRANLTRNPEIAHKITAFNLGLSSCARTEEWRYNPRFAGMTGSQPPLQTSPVGGLWRSSSAMSVGVDLERATDAIVRCSAAHPDAAVFCKIDCEGGEFEIIADLVDTGALRHLDACVVEVHAARGGDTPSLARSLSDAGFMIVGDTDTLVKPGHAVVLWAVRVAS